MSFAKRKKEKEIWTTESEKNDTRHLLDDLQFGMTFNNNTKDRKYENR